MPGWGWGRSAGWGQLGFRYACLHCLQLYLQKGGLVVGDFHTKDGIADVPGGTEHQVVASLLDQAVVIAVIGRAVYHRKGTVVIEHFDAGLQGIAAVHRSLTLPRIP